MPSFVHRLCRRSCLAVALLVAAPSVAFADDKPAPAVSEGLDDEVTLKDGGTLRGVVVSMEPGKEVKILVLGEKDPRTIPWSQVADVQKGKHAPKTTVEPGGAGEGYGDKPPPKKKAATTKKPTRPAETLPYDDTSASTPPVESPPPSGSSGRRFGGWILIMTGPAIAIGGSMPLIAKSIECSEGCTQDVYDDIVPEAVAGTCITVGVGALVGGVVLVATSGSSAPASGAAPPVAVWVGAPKETSVTIAPVAPTATPTVLGVQGAF